MFFDGQKDDPTILRGGLYWWGSAIFNKYENFCHAGSEKIGLATLL